MTISIGERVPDGSLTVPGPAGPREMPIAAELAGKSVVIFGLPGAYTGVCSTAHVPSFIRTFAAFKAKGVDEILCVSVNDAFVMRAWGEATGAAKAGIVMAADPDASFTTALGLDYAAGFSRGMTRSKRYAMHVVDGVVKVLQVEATNGVCDISGGEALLETI